MQAKRTFFRLLAAALIFGIGAISPAVHAAEVTAANLEAVVRTLGFLETLHRDTAITVGIIYAPNTAAARAQAATVADRVSAMPGPNKSTLRATPLSADSVGKAAEQLDVMYLMPGASAEADAIIDAARRRHLVTISSDPACLDQKCCVLMVRTDRGVEIILQTALAEAVGARFSTVFSMMVKRQ
jgi:F0F1-type ATP synthase membrane subunit c/vacuolar-type H+-ATPase subunit K